MFLPQYVSLSVCPSAILQKKSYERILMKLFLEGWAWPKEQSLSVIGDPDPDSNPGIFKGFFI